MNYWELIKLGFNVNSQQTVLHFFPATFFLLLTLVSVFLYCFSKKESEKTFFNQLSSISPKGEFLVGGFIYFIISLVCMPNFKWLELSYEYSKPIVEDIQIKNLSIIKKDDLSAFHNLEFQAKEMKSFKNNILNNTPKAEIIYQKDIINSFKERQSLYLMCMNDKKENYLKDLSQNDYPMGDIEEQAKSFPNECAVFVSEDIIKSRITKHNQ